MTVEAHGVESAATLRTCDGDFFVGVGRRLIHVRWLGRMAVWYVDWFIYLFPPLHTT